MTTAMRRASTVVSIPKTALSRQSSKQSLKDSLKVNPNAPSASGIGAVPSPVAESPAREAAAFANEALVGPSLLANVVSVHEPTPEPPLAPAPAPAPATDLAQITASPEQFAASLPPSQPHHDFTPEPLGFSDPVDLPSVAVTGPSPVVAPGEAPPAAEEQPVPPPTVEILPVPSSVPTEPPASEDRRADYFAFTDSENIPTVAPVAEPAPVEPPAPVVAPAPEPEPIPASEPEPVPAPRTPEPAESARLPESSYVHVPADESTFAWGEDSALAHSQPSMPEPVHRTPEPVQYMPEPVQRIHDTSQSMSTRASQSSMGSSYGQLLPDQKRGRSGSVRYVFTRVSVKIRVR